MPRRVWVAAAVLGCVGAVGTAGAHELKVFASRYLAERGEKATIYLADGHRTPVDGLVDSKAVERYDLIAPGGEATPLKKEGASLQANEVELKVDGIYTAVTSRTPGVVSIVANEDGGRSFKRGTKRELSGAKLDETFHSEQYGKAMIVVGTPGDEAPGAIGLPVEIVPLDGPSRWKVGQDVRFRVVRNGEPVRFAPIVARSMGFKPDDAWNYATETDDAGEFSLRPDRAAVWIVGVEFHRPAPAAHVEDYDSEWFASTLTFEATP